MQKICKKKFQNRYAKDKIFAMLGIIDITQVIP